MKTVKKKTNNQEWVVHEYCSFDICEYQRL